MERLYVNLLLIILAVSIGSYFIYYSGLYMYRKSEVDGKWYKVKNNKFSQQSADTLARINLNLVKLVSRISSIYSGKDITKRLNNFNPHQIAENILDIDTSYTLNKGESMVFCLIPRHANRELNNQIYDINTLMYVGIHELAHVGSKSIGHTEEFRDNFIFLLKEAISLGIYKYVDYSKKPQEYCGITISKSVLN